MNSAAFFVVRQTVSCARCRHVTSTLRVANVTATRQRTLIAASYLSPNSTLLPLDSFIYGFSASMIYGWITVIIYVFFYNLWGSLAAAVIGRGRRNLRRLWPLSVSPPNVRHYNERAVGIFRIEDPRMQHEASPPSPHMPPGGLVRSSHMA